MNGYTFERRELKYRITDAQRAELEAAFGAQMVPDEHGESTICNIILPAHPRLARKAGVQGKAAASQLRRDRAGRRGVSRAEKEIQGHCV